jgi:hypothetical protein
MTDNNPTTPTKSDGLKKAEEAAAIAKAQKDKADYDKAAAEARKDKVKAEQDREKLEATGGLGLQQAQADLISKLLPKGDAKPLEGKVEAKEVGAVIRLAAYHAIRKMAGEIAATLQGVLQNNHKVMIVPQLDFVAGDLPLVEIMEQFELFEQALTAQIKENSKILQPAAAAKGVKALKIGMARLSLVSPATAIMMAGTIIPGLANLAGYFKTDYTITGAEFELDKEGLAAGVAGALAKAGKEIYFYNFYTLWDLPTLPMIVKLTQLSKLSQELESLQGGLPSPKNQAAAGEKTAELDQALKDSQALLDAVKGYIQSITTKAAGEDCCKLVRAALRDRMRQMGITHLLYLNILPKSGGEAITKKNFFWAPEVIGYLGGAAVSYVLAETGGKTVASDLLVRLSYFNYRLAVPEESDITSIPFG